MIRNSHFYILRIEFLRNLVYNRSSYSPKAIWPDRGTRACIDLYWLISYSETYFGSRLDYDKYLYIAKRSWQMITDT